MSSGDIWFLLIFIILPTAVLVSGFWAFLFVRRDPRKTMPQRRQRPANVKSTRDGVEETVQVAAIPSVRAESEPAASEATAEEAAELGPPVPVAGPTASELAGDADAIEDHSEDVGTESEPDGDLQGPDPVELTEDEEISQTSEPAEGTVDDERLIELIDIDDRDDLMAEIQRRREAQPARLESSTDEIPDLGEALSEPARLSEVNQHNEWRRHETVEQTDAEAEPTEWDDSENELAGDAEEAPQGDAGDDDEEPARRDEHSGSKGGNSGNQRRYRRRRPRVKLLPSDNGERQERRGRLAGRRKPERERPSRRDKSGM